MIGKIVKRNGKVTEVATTACMLLSLSRCKTIESAMVERRDIDDQGAEDGLL